MTYTGLLRTALAYGNGRSTVYTYDSLLRLKDIESSLDTALGRYYAYDPVGNALSDSKESYTYNSLYELTGVNYDSAIAGSATFSYDIMGNRSVVNAKDGEGNYQSNELNQYTSRNIDGETSMFRYDANGNLTEDQKYKYSYDFKNRLIEVREKSRAVLIETAAGNGGVSGGGEVITASGSGTGSGSMIATGSGSETGSGATTGSGSITESGSGSTAEGGS